ncbi:MAG: PQQ-binding-like beta-propeller repeat protein [bacterium]
MKTHALLFALLTGCAAPAGPASRAFDTVPEAPVPEFVFEWDAQVDQIDFFGVQPVQLATPGHLSTSDELVVGTARGDVVKFQAANGNPLWRAHVDGPVATKPTSGSGNVFVGTARGELVALDVHSGQKTWEARLLSSVDSPATEADGRVFVVDAADSLYAFDALTGEALWAFQAPTPEYFTVEGSPRPVVADGEVYVGASDGVLRAFEQETGELIWSVELRGDADEFTDIDREVVVEKDVIYAASYSGGLYAVDRMSGEILWRHPATGLQDFAVYEGMVYATSATGRAFAVFAEDGAPAWGFRFQNVVPSSFTVYGPYLLVTTNGPIYVLDRRTGYPLRKMLGVHGISSEIEFGADRAYMLSDRGRLTTFKLGW